MKLVPLPAFQDNYLWVLHDGHRALVVDPGDAQPVLAFLRQSGLQLDAILVTHHHADHVGGVDEVRRATGAPVHGPAAEDIPGPYHALAGGDQVQALGFTWRVVDVPGHTAGHIAYFCDDVDGAPLLFCGDTLFSGGCGRLFEGTPAQMLASLDSLSALPAATRVCCAHEYTLSNLRFARAVEPDSPALAERDAETARRRAAGLATVPSSLGAERATNPFLRTAQPAVRRAAEARLGRAPADEVEVLAAIREWKDRFR